MKTMGRQAAIWLGILASFWAAGCGGSSGGGTTSKTTPTVTAWPTASSITYGQTLASSTLSGGTASVSGSFSWTTSTTVPGAGTPSESVTFTPADTTDYNTVTGAVGVVVSKATPTVSAWPTASAITYGETLASSMLSGGTGSVPGTFIWTNPETAPATGTASEGVTFTATDASDYNTVAGSASVMVDKATPPVSAWPTASAITYGQTLASSILSGGSTGGTFTWTTPTIVPSGGTTSQSVTFSPTDTTDYTTATGLGKRDRESGRSHRDGDSRLFEHYRHKPTCCNGCGERRSGNGDADWFGDVEWWRLHFLCDSTDEWKRAD
jgi:hypothetical protein